MQSIPLPRGSLLLMAACGQRSVIGHVLWSVGRELALGTMEVLLLEASEGKVLMQSIPLPRGSLLLMAACGQRSVIGHVLWS
ncbi:hypothetical protein, partial [Escherichia coli]|uniref:hypothetical protein n=1 Tax=Escherichia coli TaxID=562 RepID=UPI000BC561A9